MILVQISVHAASRDSSKHVKMYCLSTHRSVSPDSAKKHNFAYYQMHYF